MKKYLKLLLLLLIVFTIAGCNKDEDIKSYTIKFDADNDVVYENVVIEKQQTIDLPTPIKKGYKFLGWYPSKKFTRGTEVTKDTIIGKDITLYAKWEPINVKISIDLNGGTPEQEMQDVYNVKSNELIVLPKVYKEDCIFAGWYVGNTKHDNKEPFLEDTTLVAKFVPLSELQSEYNITLELNGGSFYNINEPLSQQTLESNNYLYMKNDNLTDQINKIHYEFISDFSEFYNAKSYSYYVKYDFFNFSYEHSLIGNTAFFSNDYYLSKWIWLIQYLEVLAEPQNKIYFQELYLNNYPKNNKLYFTESASIRAEFMGFLDVDKFIYENNDVRFESHAYNEQEILNVQNLFNLTKYLPGVEMPILAPIKEGYIFKGWYDNPDFEGEAIWKIDNTWYWDIKLYAKWEEI